MATLVVSTFVSLDGVMQAPGGQQEDRSGGFEHGGWLPPHFDETVGAFMTDMFRNVDAFLLGRTTYDIFAGSWGRVTEEDNPLAFKFNALPKYVASRTLEKADWHPSTVIRDVASEVPTLKTKLDGQLQVHGSAGLVQSLNELDLVDVYHVLTFPVVIGTGKRLFSEGAAPRTWKLTESRTSENGIVISTYERAGELTYGEATVD